MREALRPWHTVGRVSRVCSGVLGVTGAWSSLVKLRTLKKASAMTCPTSRLSSGAYSQLFTCSAFGHSDNAHLYLVIHRPLQQLLKLEVYSIRRDSHG